MSDTSASRYETLLQRDIKLITKKVPETFSGQEPVCLSVFQPTPDGGRLVLIDKGLENSTDPVWLRPGISTRASFLDPSPASRWKEGDVYADRKMLDYFRDNNPKPMRMRLLDIYKQRFPEGVQFDEEDGHVLEGTFCGVRFVNATSLRWQHLPRFGMLYTFAELFDASLRLTVEANVAGTIILAARLALFLGDRNRFLDRSAFQIGELLAGRREVSEDDILYALSKCIFVHHFLYPQDQSANILISRFSKDPERTWTRQGWPAFSIADSPDRSYEDLRDALSRDVAFLISSCGGKPELDVADRDRLTTRIRQQLPVALTILCGSVSRIAFQDDQVLILDNEDAARYPLSERYLMITPHDQIPFKERTLVPAFREDKLRDWVKKKDSALPTANAMIYDLSGHSSLHYSPSLRGYYGTECEMVDLQDSKRHHSIKKDDPRADDWLIRYARARCSISMLWQEKRKKMAKGQIQGANATRTNTS